ncbi:MAG: M20 family metallopeptidase [Sulfuricellaceae bacterium]
MPQALRSAVNRYWDESALPSLMDYIRIPCKSPHFDPDWQANGYLDQAIALAATWCRAQPIQGMSLETVRLPGRTPLLFIEIAGSSDDTVLLYGHLDKQPEVTGWRAGLGPWLPVVEDDKLYGRGAADDGYAMYAALTAVRVLQERGAPHARCVLIIECCEESGSYDLPHYVELLAPRIGAPSLVVGLDSGCGDFERLWCTLSLRGLVGGNLIVEVLEEGIHSGTASGIVPSSFRIARQLLSRIEDENSGAILPAEFHADIPAERAEQTKHTADVLGASVYAKFPFVAGMTPPSRDPGELMLNNTWRPALSVTGAAGFPPPDNAGNVLRPRTVLKLSLRLPPTCDATAATNHLKNLLECDPPYGARVQFEPEPPAPGWNAPQLAPWYAAAVQRASQTFYGQPAVFTGEGVTIPFMGMLGAKFPAAQFLIAGVLGPHANAHGPNEFLHLPAVKKLTCCVAEVLAAHAAR